MPTESELTAQVTADLDAIDHAATDACPGIADMLRLYGQYEMLTRIADPYYATLTPKIVFTTSDRSNF